jgi:DNA-binding MarR family transcriptional regulator
MKRSEIRKFREALRRFERLVAGQLKGSSGCSGVTLAQCHTLLALEAKGHATLNELTQSLSLDKSTLSRTVDGLVNSGLAKRVASDQDRRSIHLSLTLQGRRTCNRINAENDRLFSRVFQRIQPVSRHEVAQAFQELVDAMAAEISTRNPVCPTAGQITRKDQQ